MMTTQICIECREEKALSEFYKHPQMANGHVGVCKVCHKARMKLRRRTNPAVQQYERERSKFPHRRAARAATTKKWYKNNPEKYKARNIFSGKVWRGEIKKQPCAVCGATEVHGHHPDYSKPLDVVWLCPLHHHRGHADGTI